jgi:transposase-like protein
MAVNNIHTVLKKAIDSNITCKYCGLTTVTKCGSYKNVPRYWCKSCRRKFKADNNLFYMRAPAEYVYLSMDMYYQGVPVSGIRDSILQRYGQALRKELIGQWLHKFSFRALSLFKEYLPQVSDSWILSESFVIIGGQRFVAHDIIDLNSRYILSTEIADIRSRQAVTRIIDEAITKAGKKPESLLAFISHASFDNLQKWVGYPIEHISNRPSALNDNSSIIDCCLQIFCRRQDTLGNSKSPKMIRLFTDGWSLSYNYFQKQSVLGNRTPAEAANINYQIKSWHDFVDQNTINVR